MIPYYHESPYIDADTFTAVNYRHLLWIVLHFKYVDVTASSTSLIGNRVDVFSIPADMGVRQCNGKSPCSDGVTFGIEAIDQSVGVITASIDYTFVIEQTDQLSLVKTPSSYKRTWL